MVRVAHDLVPDVIGSSFGCCRDGCGIRLCGFGRGAKSITHRAAARGARVHKLLRGAGVAQRLRGGRGCNSCCRLVHGQAHGTGHFVGGRAVALHVGVIVVRVVHSQRRGIAAVGHGGDGCAGHPRPAVRQADVCQRLRRVIGHGARGRDGHRGRGGLVHGQAHGTGHFVGGRAVALHVGVIVVRVVHSQRRGIAAVGHGGDGCAGHPRPAVRQADVCQRLRRVIGHGARGRDGHRGRGRLCDVETQGLGSLRAVRPLVVGGIRQRQHHIVAADVRAAVVRGHAVERARRHGRGLCLAGVGLGGDGRGGHGGLADSNCDFCRLRVGVVRVAHDLVPDVIGSGFGAGGDGCGIRFSGFGCGTDGVLHLTSGRFAGNGHKRLFRAVICTIVRGDGGRDSIRLVDRHGHFLGSLLIDGCPRRRYDNICFAIHRNLLDGQRAGRGIHFDVIRTAILHSVADRAAARCWSGHAGDYLLVRVAVGDGHVFGGNGLVTLCDIQVAILIGNDIVRCNICIVFFYDSSGCCDRAGICKVV